MSLDRRKFVYLGALGTAGLSVGACSSWFGSKSLATNPLRVVIRGLSYVERHGHTIDVHLIDATKVGLMAHEPVVSIAKSDLISGTGPDDPFDGTRVTFAVDQGTKVTLEAGIGGPADAGEEDQPITENLPPETDDGWKSIKYAARIKTICQLSSDPTVNPAKVAGLLTLEHGKLRSMLPRQMDGSNSLGTKVRWLFKDSGGVKIVKQAMTNALLCTVPAQGTSATFHIGANNVVIKLPSEVWIRNLPPKGMPDPCTDGSDACADHLSGYYSFFDIANPPKLEVDKTAAGALTGIEPNYCPPSA
jgi:hypothetical protein